MRILKRRFFEATTSTKWDNAILKAFNEENKGEYASYDEWKNEVLRGELAYEWYSDSLTLRIFCIIVLNIAEEFLIKYETNHLKFDYPEFPELNNNDYEEESLYARCLIQNENCWNVNIIWEIEEYDEPYDTYYSDRISFKGTGVLKKGTNYECLVSYFNVYENFLNTSAAPRMDKFIEKYRSLIVDEKQLKKILSKIKDLYSQYKATCNEYIDAGGKEDDIDKVIHSINRVL